MTTLGTPLASSGFRVMLLGSGELGKEVVIELQQEIESLKRRCAALERARIESTLALPPHRWLPAPRHNGHALPGRPD